MTDLETIQTIRELDKERSELRQDSAAMAAGKAAYKRAVGFKPGEKDDVTVSLSRWERHLDEKVVSLGQRIVRLRAAGTDRS